MEKPKKKNGSSDNGQFWYDEDAAQRAVDFFAQCLVHTKGEWAGQPFLLAPWQEQQLIRPLFGWKRKDGTRKYRTVWVELARKNGKTTTASGIALYLLFADQEPGAEIISAAADREQAAICFDIAKAMVEASPLLSKRAEIYRRSIVVPATNSSYKVISADAYTKHGLNLHGALIDEVHAQQSRDLIDVLRTSTGARRQPVTFYITTAGYDRQSIAFELHEYACKVRDEIVKDASFLPLLFGAEDADDWADPAVWRKANPSLNISVKEEYLAQECEHAKETPAYENTFRRLHLSQWTEQSVRWMPMEAWDSCDFERVTIEQLAGRDVYIGLDLSSTTDLTSVALVAPPAEEGGTYQVVWEHFVPADNMALRAKRDRVDYGQWVREGYITATPGNVVDQAFIEKRILTISETCHVKEIAYDPWNSTAIITRLQESGATCVQFRQGFFSMNAPVKEVMALVLSQRINHGGNPVARWGMSNAVVKEDPAGNLKLDRAKSTEKIDPCISLVMALGRAMVRVTEPASIYERRGLVSL